MSDLEPVADAFAHLRLRAAERSDRTVQRLRAGIAALRAKTETITGESIRQTIREQEPGFTGLSFQVIRRNPRAHALYREAADAFSMPPPATSHQKKRRQRGRSDRRRIPHASYDTLQRLDKRNLVRRIRALEAELEGERQKRSALAYDQQSMRARILRLETEIVLMRSE